jgi:hypothetical protein
MAIDRTNYNALVDDDGSNLVGTPWTKNIVKTVVLDPIDAALALLTPAPAAPQTTTLVGTQNNFGLAAGVTTLRCNNATDLTITGIGAGTDGQRLRVLAVGAGHVYLSPQAAGSTAANRLLNPCTSASTPLAAGVGVAEYQYDATTARWRLVLHDQGAAVPYTPTWTGQTTNPTLGNGTVTGSYLLFGRVMDVFVQLVIGSTTTLGTGQWLFSLPIPLSGTATTGTGFVTSGGGATNNPILTPITAFVHASGDMTGLLTASAANVSNVAPAGLATGDVFRGAVFDVPVA